MNQYTIKNKFGLIYIVRADNEKDAITAAIHRDMVSGLCQDDYKII